MKVPGTASSALGSVTRPDRRPLPATQETLPAAWETLPRCLVGSPKYSGGHTSAICSLSQLPRRVSHRRWRASRVPMSPLPGTPERLPVPFQAHDRPWIVSPEWSGEPPSTSCRPTQVARSRSELVRRLSQVLSCAVPAGDVSAPSHFIPGPNQVHGAAGALVRRPKRSARGSQVLSRGYEGDPRCRARDCWPGDPRSDGCSFECQLRQSSLDAAKLDSAVSIESHRSHELSSSD